MELNFTFQSRSNDEISPQTRRNIFLHTVTNTLWRRAQMYKLRLPDRGTTFQFAQLCARLYVQEQRHASRIGSGVH